MVMELKKRVFFYLRLSLSVGLVTFFVFSLDIGQSLASLPSFGWGYITLAVLVINLDRILMAYKWNILVQAKGLVLPFLEILGTYFIGIFWGSFLPVPLGGDVVRVHLISRHMKGSQHALSSVLLERILGALTSFLLGGVCAVVFLLVIRANNWIIVLALVFAYLCVLGVVALSFNIRLSRWLEKRFLLRKRGLQAKLAQVYHSYQEYRHNRGPVLRFLLFSLLEQCLPIVSAFFVSKALHLNIPFWGFVLFVPMILALSRIPVSLNGFGVYEVLNVYFFSFLGVGGGEAFLLGLLSHVMALVSILPGFFYFSFVRYPPRLSRAALIG